MSNTETRLTLLEETVAKQRAEIATLKTQLTKTRERIDGKQWQSLERRIAELERTGSDLDSMRNLARALSQFVQDENRDWGR